MRTKMTAAILSALLTVCAALALCGCTGYDGENITENNMLFYINKSGDKAYVSVYYWDLDPDSTDIYIPDTVSGGAVVTKIGGFMGTGVPCPFHVVYEGEDCVRESYPERVQFNAPCEWSDVVFTLHVGRYIEDVTYFGELGYYGRMNADGSYVLYRPVYRFECDPENPVMYSRDGMLYFRKDGSPVLDEKIDMPEPREPGSFVPEVSGSDAVSPSD